MIRMLNADPSVVSNRAKKRGLPQLGTLGAGNHYAEIQVGYSCILLCANDRLDLVIRFSYWCHYQVVDEIYDKFAASKMGIEETGQVKWMSQFRFSDFFLIRWC